MKKNDEIRGIIARIRRWRNAPLLAGPGNSGTTDSRHYRETMVSILCGQLRDLLASR